MSNPAKGQSGDGQQHETVSAKDQKAAEVQAIGSAKAGAGHPEVLEGGKAEIRQKVRDTRSRPRRTHHLAQRATPPRARQRKAEKGGCSRGRRREGAARPWAPQG